MAPHSYSFIDIAVMDEIRSRFAQGDALALLDCSLDTIMWANGPGARLLGFADIATTIGAASGLGTAARRQIAAAPGFPDLAGPAPVMVRITGSGSRAIPLSVVSVGMPGGERAILLAAEADRLASPGQSAIAEEAVAGFNADSGFFAAIVDGKGDALAGSEGFAALGIGQAALRELVDEVRREPDRLVKRLVQADGRLVPAGVARLTDEPALHLLIAVDEGEAEPAATAVRSRNADAANDDHASPENEFEPVRDDVAPPQVDRGSDEAAAEDGDHPNSDRWYFGGEEAQDAAPAPENIAEAPAFVPDLDRPPIRFVWRTDAEGRFSELSQEFVDAVGPGAADVIGRRFADVATVFNLDPERRIVELLQRRDTWSGRTVMWPVMGSDRRVPVDLAALPVYGRDRVFEGFRGFGVLKMGESVADPEALGLTLAPPSAPHGAPAAEEAPESPPPALAISATPERRDSDKVIRLAERRAQNEPGGLSPNERTAFQEIAVRLKRDQETFADEQPPAEDRQADEEISAETAEEPVAEEPFPAGEEDRHQPAPEAENGEAIQPASEAEENIGDDIVETVEDANDAQEFELADAGNAEADAAGDEPGPAEPAESMPDGIDAALLGPLPLAALVHVGDELIFANREFFTLTGFADLDQLAASGGLDGLFADPPPHGREGRLRLVGAETAVEARLQSIRWQRRSALMLTLRPSPADVEALEAQLAAARKDRAEVERRIEELRMIVDTATDGVVLIAPDGTVRSISRPAEALFGYDSDELEGEPFASLFAIESQRAARDYLNGLAENGVASVLNDGREVIGREAEGRFIPLFMTIGRLPGEGGYCAVLRDITQWKRAEEELTKARADAENASSQKSDFLARVSHEVRTPLNAIIGFSELMIDEKFGPIGSDRYRDYLRDINRSGNHVLDLVNDLLDISKIEAGEQEMNYEAVSLNEALADSVALMQPQANRERVIIRSSLASRLPEVVADLRSIRQIALNLLSNAVRYTRPGGQVIVSTAYEPSGDVVMRVRDTGIGMSLSEIDQALKPFKQINALKRGRNDGTGLGLPLTKAMVEANRARFAISSQPGEGTLVEITFPSTRVLAD